MLKGLEDRVKSFATRAAFSFRIFYQSSIRPRHFKRGKREKRGREKRNYSHDSRASACRRGIIGGIYLKTGMCNMLDGP